MKDREAWRDEIRLTGVRLATHIGVPEEERQLPQTVEADVVLVPRGGLGGEGDELDRTVNYQAVWQRLREVAGARPRRLVETLAQDLADTLLREFPLREVGIEIRKSILPGTESVGVRIWRRRAPGS